MKYRHLGLYSSLLISATSFAVNPVQGFYVGLIGEGSKGPSNYPFTLTVNNTASFPGYVENTGYGGGGGGVFGFRAQKFRVEGELLFNYITANSFTIGDCTLSNPGIDTPYGTCPAIIRQNALGFSGSTTAGYALVNAFYDFVNYGGEQALVPYLGLGIGGVYLRQRVAFTNSNTLDAGTTSVTGSAAAAQGIIGLSFYLDDYTWAGLDYRYLSSSTFSFINDSRYSLNTINFVINCSFDNASLNGEK